MSLRQFLVSALLAGLLSLRAFQAFPASDAPAGKGAGEKSVESEIARYCGAIAPSAAEARLAWQMGRLVELETRVRQSLDDLAKREQDAREWVLKRERMSKIATDDLVGIYNKMQAETAAAQLSAMDDTIAAAVLMKLKPQVAAGILNEMNAEHAGHLETLMAGGAFGAGKS